MSRDRQTAVHTIDSALAAMGAELTVIDQELRTTQLGLVNAYQRTIALIVQYRGALVDEVSGRLRAGVWKSFEKLCPALERSTFCTAWRAFQRDPVAFAACRTIRELRNVGKVGPQANSPAADAAKVLARYRSVIKAAMQAGIDAGTLARVLAQQTTVPRAAVA